MKRNTVKHEPRRHSATLPLIKPSAAPPRLQTEHDREFIRAMNAFVEKNGTITDDEFFRVL